MPWFLIGFVAWLFNVVIRVMTLFTAFFTRFKGWLTISFMALLVNGIGGLVYRVLGSLGIGYVVYNLSGFGLDTLFNQLETSIQQVPLELITFIQMARVDDFISILFSALSARLFLLGVTALSMRRARTFYA